MNNKTVALANFDYCQEFQRTDLPGIDLLPIQLTSAPAVEGFPHSVLNGDWLIEAGVVASIGLTLLTIFFLVRRKRNGATMPSQKHREKVGRVINKVWTKGDFALVIGAGVLFLIALAHGMVSNRMEIEVGIAEAQFLAERYDSVQIALNRAQICADWAPLGALEITGYRLALRRVPLKRMQEVLGIQAVIKAVEEKKKVDMENSLKYFGEVEDISSQESRQALLYCWSALAREASEIGDFQKALSLTSLGLVYEAALDYQILLQNHCRAKYHFILGQIDAGDPETVSEMIDTLDQVPCSIDSNIQVLLRTHMARTLAALELGRNDQPDTLLVIDHLESAYNYSAKYMHPYVHIICDLVAALDTHALVLLSQERAQDAVATLDRSFELLPNRKFVAELRPKALLMWAFTEMKAKNWHNALLILERARNEALVDKSQLVDALISVYQSLGMEDQKKNNLDNVIYWYILAHELAPEDPTLTNNLGQAHLIRGKTLLKQGFTQKARLDFLASKDLSPALAISAKKYLQSLEIGVRRLREWSDSPKWIMTTPAPVGFLPIYSDGNDTPNFFAFYSPGINHPIGFAEAQFMGKIFLNNRDGEVISLIKDRDGLGNYDERTDYESGYSRQRVVDLDNDQNPDVRRLFSDPKTFTDKPLSGRIVMIMKSGVIGTNTDWAGEPDSYIKLFKNQAYLGKTDTSWDTYYPIWNQGIVVNYKYGDNIKIEVWDEDPVFDDFIDYYQIDHLPMDGIYQFENRKAAIQIETRPSKLEEGLNTNIQTPTLPKNIFFDSPKKVPEVGDIIAGAKFFENAIQIKNEMGEWVQTNLVIPRLFPSQGIDSSQIAEQILKSARNVER